MSANKVVVLTVTDNGVGFTPGEQTEIRMDEHMEIGFRGIAERVGLYGGVFHIRSRPDFPGCVASVRMPDRRNTEAANV